ncbi:MAG: YqgE/AlgH family protein [Odoribacter sp.]|nr:YqgE/AlgH family protein [Odoribacter sp.]
MDELFQDLFTIRSNRKNVRVGDILIAEPFLEGKYFARAVVYITEHDEEGSIGFVLNKPMYYDTCDLAGELEGIHIPVYIGGPVEQDQLYYLHCYPELRDSVPVADGIYWGGDFEQLLHLLKEGEILPGEIRFFAGYSGWKAGQLKKELDENSWMVGRITFERFFEDFDNDLWKKSMEELGGVHRIWADFPENPIMN